MFMFCFKNEDLWFDGNSSKQAVGRFELSLDLNKTGGPLLQEVWHVKDVSVLLIKAIRSSALLTSTFSPNDINGDF